MVIVHLEIGLSVGESFRRTPYLLLAFAENMAMGWLFLSSAKPAAIEDLCGQEALDGCYFAAKNSKNSQHSLRRRRR
jgi:hypothetical protein